MQNAGEPTLDAYLFCRYGIVASITLIVILTSIAAITDLPTTDRSTIYIDNDIDHNLTKNVVLDTLMETNSLFYFIDVKDYNCRKNDSLLNYVLLKGHVSTPPLLVQSSRTHFFANELVVRFCPQNSSHRDLYTVSLLFSSGCSEEVTGVCRPLNLPCNITLSDRLPLCNASNKVILEWKAFLEIRKNLTTRIIRIFRSRTKLD